MLIADLPATLQSVPAIARPVAGAAAEAGDPGTVRGIVRDKSTGAPIAGATVRQPGEVASAVSALDGAFSFRLQPFGDRAVVVSAEHFGTQRLSLSWNESLDIRLAPLQRPAITAAPAASAHAQALSEKPLASGMSLGFRYAQPSIAAGGTSAGSLRMGARLRQESWLLEADGLQFQSNLVMPTVAAGFQAFEPRLWNAGLRAGYVMSWDRNVDAALQVGYRYSSAMPLGGATAAGGAVALDMNQHAVGPVMTLGYRPGGDRLTLEGTVGIYPLVMSNLQSPGLTQLVSGVTETWLGAFYEFIPGVQTGLAYQFAQWRGLASDPTQVLSFVMRFSAGKMASM